LNITIRMINSAEQFSFEHVSLFHSTQTSAKRSSTSVWPPPITETRYYHHSHRLQTTAHFSL